MQTTDTIIKPVTDKNSAPEVDWKKGAIHCRHCNYKITHQDFACAIDGEHQHLQCNPAGFTFVFCCFSRAIGCFINGQPTEEDCWFKGYQWQYCSCEGCGEHLGWYYSNSNDAFLGLIKNKLRLGG